MFCLLGGYDSVDARANLESWSYSIERAMRALLRFVVYPYCGSDRAFLPNKSGSVHHTRRLGAEQIRPGRYKLQTCNPERA